MVWLPVAVVALLKELGAPEELATTIEGESLLNDGSAFVLFVVFKQNVEKLINQEDPLSAGEVIGLLFRLALGGPLLGIVLGWFTVHIAKR